MLCELSFCSINVRSRNNSVPQAEEEEKLFGCVHRHHNFVLCLKAPCSRNACLPCVGYNWSVNSLSGVVATWQYKCCGPVYFVSVLKLSRKLSYCSCAFCFIMYFYCSVRSLYGCLLVRTTFTSSFTTTYLNALVRITICVTKCNDFPLELFILRRVRRAVGEKCL